MSAPHDYDSTGHCKVCGALRCPNCGRSEAEHNGTERHGCIVFSEMEPMESQHYRNEKAKATAPQPTLCSVCSKPFTIDQHEQALRGTHDACSQQSVCVCGNERLAHHGLGEYCTPLRSGARTPGDSERFTPSPAPASGAETTTYCPERAKMSSDRRWAKHVAAYDNGTMVNTEGDPLRSICGACGVPIARSHRTSAQWHSAVPSPGTPRSRPTPPSDAGTSEREMCPDCPHAPHLGTPCAECRRFGGFRGECSHQGAKGRPAAEGPRNKEMTLRYVYVEQYGAWWRLTWRQWFVCVADALNGDSFVLPEEAQLTRRPANVRELRGPDWRHLTVRHPCDLYVTPLDWTHDQWEEAATELVQRGCPDPTGAAL